MSRIAHGWARGAAPVMLGGTAWLHDPALGSALAAGVTTVVFPLFVMQPAMGAGIAGLRTSTPLKNALRSLATHTIFGCGLYVSAAVLKWIWA